MALLPNESNSYSIHVEVAGSFGNLFLSQVSQWTDVVALTITGTLNSDDLAYLSRMSNLQVLDLSGTNITSVSGCSGLTHLTEVILPNSVTTIAANAFEGCQMLRNINLENISSIGNSSFYDCYGLRELSLPNVESIGNSAFYVCRNLSKVEMPKVQSIGQYAFYDCSLVSVDLSAVTSLGSSAFNSNDSLQKVVLSDYLYKIPDDCFKYCQNLSDINIPLYVSSIGSYAFYNVPIKNVVLPEGVTVVGNNNFNVSDTIVLPSTLTAFSSYSSNWKEVYCYLISPQSFSMVTSCNDCYSNTRLHVPAFSVAAYKLDDNWYKFKEILPIEGDVSNISINSPFSLYSVSGISNEANLSLQSGGSLTTMANDTLKLSNYVQNIDTRWDYNRSYSYDENGNYYEYYSKSSSYMSSLVANSPIKADNVVYYVMIYFDRWNFISFPFDVNISDIVAPYNTKWVIREYNGTNRALGTGVTWENVAEDAVLKAHKGYILYASKSSYSYNWFSFPASNQTRQNVFATTDQAVPLSHYEAEYAQNKSWNLVGNPYPCAIDISSTDFTAPITVWYGGGYTAYSPLDDNYVLRPGEAFFVQAPDGSDAITFSKDGRSADMSFQVLYDEYNTNRYYAPAKVRNSDNRKVYNFVVTDNENFDRARVVFNENGRIGHFAGWDMLSAPINIGVSEVSNISDTKFAVENAL